MKKSLELDKKIFLKKFEKILDNFYQKLQDYIKNPNDENIHDIRVGIRRLEAAHRDTSKKNTKERRDRKLYKTSKDAFQIECKDKRF